MVNTESLKSIENLHRMKAEGIITEAEFEQSKQQILFGPAKADPVTAAVPAPKPDQPFAWMVLPFRRYAEFTGRSSRKEFWLFLLLVNIVAAPLLLFAATSTDIYDEPTAAARGALALFVVVLLATIVPLLAVEVRRFHDQERSGWFALLNLIPYVGALVVLVFMVLPGTVGENRFGLDPKQAG